MSYDDTFIRIASEEDESDSLELPLESDGSILLSTINTLFPSATGLKYRNIENNAFRTLKCVDGKLFPPANISLSMTTFFCTMPKDIKRKGSEGLPSDIPSKNQRLDVSIIKPCTDIVVLGLPWKTDENTMREYFSKYGEIAMAQVKRNPSTGQSKGFGFIRFVEYGAQVSCLSERHYIDGRWCEVKIPDSKMYSDRQEVSRKVYVGGLAEHITADDIREIFTQYGIVTDVFIPKPFRNFAFVSFADPLVAQNLLGKSVHCCNILLNIQAAAPKLPGNNRNNQTMINNGGQQYRGSGIDYFNMQNNALPNGDQNAVAMAAINMLKNPQLLSSLLSLNTGSQQQNQFSASTSSHY